jgi:hypothetical protein
MTHISLYFLQVKIVFILRLKVSLKREILVKHERRYDSNQLDMLHELPKSSESLVQYKHQV